MKVDYRVLCLSYAPKGDILAVGDNGGNINFFNSQGEKLQSPVNVDDVVQSVHWSPCGTKIAAAWNDYDTGIYCVKILNSETGALLCALTGHTR